MRTTRAATAATAAPPAAAGTAVSVAAPPLVCEELIRLLTECGMEAFGPKFASEQLNLATLLRLSDDDTAEVLKELKLTIGARIGIGRALEAKRSA